MATSAKETITTASNGDQKHQSGCYACEDFASTGDIIAIHLAVAIEVATFVITALRIRQAVDALFSTDTL